MWTTVYARQNRWWYSYIPKQLRAKGGGSIGKGGGGRRQRIFICLLPLAAFSQTHAA